MVKQHFTNKLESKGWQLGWWQSNLLSYGIIARTVDKKVRKHSHTEYLPQDSKSEYLLLKVMLSAQIRQD